MPQITTMFWDIGGVLLTNAWDRHEREAAFEKFSLDPTEFEERHRPVISPFETGEMTLDQYLDHTVFYRERAFTREALKDFMLSCSRPNPAALQIARSLAATGRYRMGTINNESRELNLYRIATFELRNFLGFFVSSCFVGLRKPDLKIYILAVDLMQRSPEECCFIDDRAENLDPAKKLGMHTIHMQSAEQLQQDLKNLEVL